MGVPTQAVDCSAWTDGDAITAEVDNILQNGMYAETEIMIYYSWYYWLMWVWNLNMHAYFDYVTALAQCNETNGAGSDYGQSWLDETMAPVIAETFQPIWDIVDLFWAPYIAMIPFAAYAIWWIPFVGWFVAYFAYWVMWATVLGYTITNVIFIFVMEW